jgi:selenocysteine-specific elongation factor
MRRLVLGTAGHIDHGKTALVRALTGVDTDRLPEEKRRGITIDLGFANLRLPDGTELGVVDVPGHEAFVRNMLAGATGIDLVLLVIAADEGVMPQTREHAAIVDLLGVRHGVVALTKADLVEPDWLELVRDDVTGLLAGTALNDALQVAVSARTGAGLTELLDALAGAAARTGGRPGSDLFRMPIDRAFTVRGTGTVVTGTVWSGSLHRDAQVRVEPAGFDARVRGLQRHGAACDALAAGDRGAVALAGVDRAAVRRGDVLLQGRGWAAAGTLTVMLRVLADAPAAVRHRQRVRVSIGTAEVLARVALPGGELEPGQQAVAQLRLEQPVVARAGDRFVVRAYSPVRTIAGGRVLEPQAPKRKRWPAALNDALESAGGSDPAARIAAAVVLAGDDGVVLESLPVLTGLPPAALDAALDGMAVVERCGGVLLPAAELERCRTDVLRRIADHHAARPLDEGIERDALRRALGGIASTVFDAAVARLLEQAVLQPRGHALAVAGHEPRPSPEQAALAAALAALFEAAALQPPEPDELPAALRTPDTPALLRHLERQGVLLRLASNRWASAAAVADGISALRAELPVGTEVGIAEFKQVLNLSRKHLLPLLEYLDRVGVTARAGDARVVAGAVDQPLTT